MKKIEFLTEDELNRLLLTLKSISRQKDIFNNQINYNKVFQEYFILNLLLDCVFSEEESSSGINVNLKAIIIPLDKKKLMEKYHNEFLSIMNYVNGSDFLHIEHTFSITESVSENVIFLKEELFSTKS